MIYLYDNNGNQLSVTKSVYDDVYGSEQITLNQYDLLNQLIKTSTPDSKVISNIYNSEGKRVAKDVNGDTTRYLYESDKVILETDDSGNEKAKNVYGTNLIARTVDDLTGYYFYNGHGDVTVVGDIYDVTLGLYAYDAFGNLESVQESVYGDVYGSSGFDNPYRYAGYYYDDETGMYYLQSRFYDPETARFLSEDTYRGQANDPLSLNLYTYVSNNPLKYTDPTGHWQETDATLDKTSRIEISRLTDLYYATKDAGERGKIADAASLVRKNAGKAIDVSTTGKSYTNTTSVKKTGVISAKDWQSISTTMTSNDDRSYKTSTISKLNLSSVNAITAGLGPRELKTYFPPQDIGYVGVHKVAGNNYHTSIILEVDKSSKYYNDSRFLNMEGSELKYATIGAGPEGIVFLPGKDKMISNINRPKDKKLDNKVELIPIEVNDEKITELFKLEENYANNNQKLKYPIEYDLWPKASNDGYNSNSFTSGLIKTAGYENVAKPSYNVPGWDKPVPEEMFQSKEDK